MAKNAIASQRFELQDMIWLSVAIGGSLGAMIRYAFAHYLPFDGHSFPWATLVVNVLGCFLIGALYVLMVDKQILSLDWRPFLSVGLLGALTTFSTFSLESLLLWQNQHMGLALIYSASTLLSCYVAVAFGYFFIQHIIR